MRRTSGSYLLLILVPSLVAFPLTSILVLDTTRYPSTTTVNSSFVLSSGIVSWEDPCSKALTSANCTYNVALAALHAQVVNSAPYTIAGVTLTPPYGTRGIPYDAFRSFSTIAATSRFGDESSRYCLPIMPTQSVYCSEDKTGTRASYGWDGRSQKITINPNTNYSDEKLRIWIINGTMTVALSLVPDEANLTIVTGSGRYADILSQLAYGRNATTNEVTFVCNITTSYEWQWINFEYSQGQSNFTITGDTCPTSEGGLVSLSYALEGTTSLSGMIDGYSKLINADVLSSAASMSIGSRLIQHAFKDYASAANMTMLESLFSQMYEVVQTAWTATSPPGSNSSFIQTQSDYHMYTMTVHFSITSLVALVAALFAFTAISLQALLWYSATRKTTRRELKLLDPIELILSMAERDVERSPRVSKDGTESIVGVNGVTKIRPLPSLDSMSSVSSRALLGEEFSKEINEFLNWWRDKPARGEQSA